MSDALPLEEGPVEQLTRALLGCVRDHYLRRPTSRATALEVLNALAIATAPIFAAARECGNEEEAREFFNVAIDHQIDGEDGIPANVAALLGWHA